jgi:hypothetical protein
MRYDRPRPVASPSLPPGGEASPASSLFHVEGVNAMSEPRCVCGRGKLPDSRPLATSPEQAEVVQRLAIIRESKIAAMRCTPPDFQRCDDLAREERDLRSRLTRLVYGAE